MTNSSFTTIINLLRATALLEERFSGELASVHGVAINEAMLLLHLQSAPLHRLTRIELAKRLHLNPSTVTRMALPMEKTGLVARQPDPRDARLAYVVLTDTGLAVAQEIRGTLGHRSTEFFRDRWTTDEIEMLGGLLARLTANEPGELV